MKIVARLVDSVIAAVRAPCRVKCSVVTNATALGRGARRLPRFSRSVRYS
jgi:hypothetical protein